MFDDMAASFNHTLPSLFLQFPSVRPFCATSKVLWNYRRWV